jgi:hypothetical protein
MSSSTADPAIAVAAPAAAAPVAAAPYWPLTVTEANAWDFSYMNDSWCSDNLKDGILAVIHANETPTLKGKEINAWKYLSEYSPPSNQGFMFSCGDDEIVSLVQNQMKVGHSGGSMGWTMRNIEFIAKKGLSVHRETYVGNQ